MVNAKYFMGASKGHSRKSDSDFYTVSVLYVDGNRITNSKKTLINHLLNCIEKGSRTVKTFTTPIPITVNIKHRDSIEI